MIRIISDERCDEKTRGNVFVRIFHLRRIHVDVYHVVSLSPVPEVEDERENTEKGNTANYTTRDCSNVHCIRLVSGPGRA